MLKQNKRTKTKHKPKPTFNCKKCSCVCVYHCVQLSYTTQHRTVLIIFPLILQTIVVAQMMSTGGEGGKLTINRSRWIQWTRPHLNLQHHNCSSLIMECATGAQFTVICESHIFNKPQNQHIITESFTGRTLFQTPNQQCQSTDKDIHPHNTKT